MTELALLQCRGLVKRYGASRALDGADLEVRRGEVHALLGENGAGKSTLLRLAAGAERPDEGVMTWRGKPYLPNGPADAARSGVAIIHQEPALAPALTVEDNLALGREARRFGFVRRRALRARVEAALARFPHPELAPDRPVGTLSAAARQLVDIARALVFDADLVVMDEPTSSLSRPDAERLFGVVRELAAEGRAVVYVSHFLEEVRAVSDRFTVLRDGRAVSTGAVATACVGDWIEAMAGRRVDELFPPRRGEPGAVVLSAEHLRGAGLPVDAGFSLRRGEVLGLAGLSGAGRTELLRALYGLAPITGGSVVVKGVPGAPGSPHEAVARGMGFLSEDRRGEGLAVELSLAVNACLSRLSPPARFGFVRRAELAAAAERRFAALGVKRRGPEDRAAELSGGNQQKVAFARLLHQEADVLFLDEPTRGVDVRSKAEIYRLIQDAAAAGKAILLASSYPPELLGTARRIAVMHRGRLGPARPAEEWTEASLVAATIAGEEGAAA
jgi:ribose transport system ATP-binding protein